MTTIKLPLLLSLPLIAINSMASTNTASAKDCKTFNYNTELVMGYTICVSDSLADSKVSSYGPDMLEDRDTKTAWCTNEQSGENARWAEFSWSEGATLKGFTLYNGYQKSQKTFTENARAQDIDITTDSGLNINVILKDQAGPQTITFQNWHNLKKLKISINNIWSGSKYPDLCITGVDFDLEARRELEWKLMQEEDAKIEARQNKK